MKPLIFTNDVSLELQHIIDSSDYDSIFILCDVNTANMCYPKLTPQHWLDSAKTITIGYGDHCKTIDTAIDIWNYLSQNDASRHSLLINLGGGMVCDIGGFTASTFKRGIDFINIPTTLLAMIDASVGGKTGINLNELKNEVGCFAMPKTVIICQRFLGTLKHTDFLSGCGEMIKHALLDNTEHWAEIIKSIDDETIAHKMSTLLPLSINVKQQYVDADPTEHGIRKALNLGHTIGHAIETWSHRHDNPIEHGICVAYGLVGALYLSCMRLNFPTDKMRQTVKTIRQTFPPCTFGCDDYAELTSIISHDKKNKGTDIRFTLLSDIGKPQIDQIVTKAEIGETLDFIRDGA